MEGGTLEKTPRQRAIEQLQKKRAFRSHVVTYLAVNAFLVVIWALTTADDGGLFWPIFPIVGWGIGVVANAWEVYGRGEISEEEIRREEERLRS